MRFLTRTRGFSFLEMMVVMMLALLLLGMSWPSFQSFWAKNQEQSYLELLEKGLNFARQQALLRQSVIGFCLSNDRRTCAEDAGNGFLIYKKESDHFMLLYAERFSRDQKNLYWRGFPHHQHLEFLPNGMTNNENGSFWHCVAHHDVPVWLVVVNKAGRARTVTNMPLNPDPNLRALGYGNLPPEYRIRCPA